MAFELVALPRLRKDFERTPPRIRQAIREKLDELAADPFHANMDIKPLRAIDARPPILRLRLSSYRILFQIDRDKKQIRVLRIGPRDRIYRGLNP